MEASSEIRVSLFYLKASIHELILTDNNRAKAPEFLSYAYIPYLSFTSFFLVFFFCVPVLPCFPFLRFPFLPTHIPVTHPTAMKYVRSDNTLDTESCKSYR